MSTDVTATNVALRLRGPVSLDRAAQLFRQGDTNNDGKLDRKETAKLVISLDTQNRNDKSEADLFARFLTGGGDKKGLKPVFFGADGKLLAAPDQTVDSFTIADLAKLASTDATTTAGNGLIIDQPDFAAAFGTRVTGEELGYDIAKIRDIANEGTPPVSTGDIKDILRQIIQILIVLISSRRGGVQAGYIPPGANLGGFNPGTTGSSTF